MMETLDYGSEVEALDDDLGNDNSKSANSCMQNALGRYDDLVSQFTERLKAWQIFTLVGLSYTTLTKLITSIFAGL